MLRVYEHLLLEVVADPSLYLSAEHLLNPYIFKGLAYLYLSEPPAPIKRWNALLYYICHAQLDFTARKAR